MQLFSTESRQARELRGHDEVTTDAVLARDGRWVASVGGEGVVRVYPVSASDEVHAGATAGSAIMQGGQMLLWLGDRLVVRDRAGVDAEIARVPHGPSMDVGSLSLDGNVVAYLDGGVAKIVERAAQRRATFGPYPDGPIAVTNLSPDGRRLALGGESGVVRIVDIPRGQARVLGRHSDLVFNVAFSQDGRALVSAGRDRTARIWSLDSEEVVTLAEHGGGVWDAQFSPDGRWVVTASLDGIVRCFDRRGALIRLLRGHEGAVLSVQVTPDGREVLSAGSDGTVRRWSMDTGQGIVLHRRPESISLARYSADRRSVSFQTSQGVIVIDANPAATQIEGVAKLAAWLASATSAEVDDTGRVESH
jgi:WD40 repeat protein